MFNGKGKKDYSQVNLDDFSDDDSDMGNDGDFAENSIRNQQELMKQQDEGLDVLSQSVDRLGQMSMAISEELGQQNQMLSAMETDLDQAGEELDIVTKKTKELIAKAGGTGNFCIIAILSIVVLVLLFLILYT
mmetsp:Transcript_15108/g.28290  ORF Transcript_15108/g.28290 Transcript_15108/m.28290 type:complete len:133 (-) Transcript_15108:143-541(-)